MIGKIGRNHPMKNHYGFIKAIDKVIARNKNVMFVIIRRGVREDKNIEAHINNKNIGSFVKLIDEQNNIHEQINLFDCLVMNSSWGEAFPNVIGEAMLSEIPCIVTDIGDSKRIIGDKGIIVKPNCENDLAKAINEIIDMNKDDYEYLGKTAREKIIKNYSISSVYEKYNKIYVNG